MANEFSRISDAVDALAQGANLSKRAIHVGTIVSALRELEQRFAHFEARLAALERGLTPRP